MCYRNNGKPKIEIEQEDEEDDDMEESEGSGSNKDRTTFSKPKVDFSMLADYMAFVNRRRTLMADEHARKTYERRD